MMKNGEEVKRYKVREAFMFDGFRVLVDDYKYGKKNSVMVADDGKSDRVFSTEERALECIFNFTDKAMTLGIIDEYLVREVRI